MKAQQKSAWNILPRFMNFRLGTRSVAMKASPFLRWPYINMDESMQAKRDIISMSPVFKASKLFMPTD